MNTIVSDLLKKLEQCDDFHNRCDYLMEHSEITYLLDYINKIEDEIERLNNIINELEKYINEEYIYDELGMKIFDASKLQDKLQELKGTDKE